MIDFAVFIVALFGVASAVPVQTKIAGGRETTINEHPYQLLLKQQQSETVWFFTCGAVIIGPNTALTTSSCSQGTGGIEVLSGSTLVNRGTNHTVKKYVQHPDYNVVNGIPDNDISFLVVEPDFVFDETTQPIEIATIEPSAGDIAMITGWGTPFEDEPVVMVKLQEATIPIVDHDSCTESYQAVGEITDGMICAGIDEGGIGSCEYDTGGPLTINGVLSGLASWSTGCAKAGFPSVYTNVAKYADWINEQKELAK